MLKILAAMICLSLVAACAHATVTTAPETTQGSIAPSSTALVSRPENGRYGEILYDNSGEMTAEIIGAAFAAVLSRVEVADSTSELEASLADARNRNLAYLIVPQILHWEDRATEWSGISDKVTVKVSIFEVGSGKLISSSVINGKSAWATFGGDHPQDLLPKPANELAQSVVQ